jgi:type I restriction enzyme, S subunit
MTQYELHQCLVEYASGVWGDEDLTNGISVLRSTNFKNDGRLDLSKRTYRNIPVDVKKKKILKPKDILLEKSGGSPKQPVGRVCYFDDEEPHMCGNFIAFLRVDTNICLPRYLFWVLHNLYKRGSTLQLQKQTTGIRNLDYKRYLKQKITLPSLKEEQQRIVEILDRAENIRRLRQQAIETTQRIAPALFYEMFGNPVRNEKGWEEQVLADIIERFEGGRSVAASADGQDTNRYRVLKISAVTSGYYQPDESKVLPASYQPEESHIVKNGDLLFSRANTSQLVGATAYVFDTPDKMLLPDKLWRFVWKRDAVVEPLYIWAMLQTGEMRQKLSSLSSGTGGSMKNISQRKLKTMSIPLPPIELQRQYTHTYMKILSCTKLLDGAKHTSQRLSSALSAQLLAA